VGRALIVAAAAAVVAAGTGARAPTPGCATAATPASYSRSVQRALRAGEDVWGNALLRSPGGPTFAGATRYLKPLLLARGPQQKPLTRSGVYYVPFVDPSSGYVALHVADGSELIVQRVGGTTLTVDVGGERFGACSSRLATPRLLHGYLPVLQTSYVDAHGNAYEQESFVTQSRSFIHLTASADVTLRFVSPASALARQGSAYLTWRGGRPLEIDESTYDQARQSVADYWTARLAHGATFVVPERRVFDAERALLVQNLELGWRYSIGNAYQELEFPESVDGAEVMGEYGFGDTERATVELALRQRLALYPNWERGTKLLAAARYYRLFADAAFLHRATPTLLRYVHDLAAQLARSPNGLLRRERYASDLPDIVYGLDSQAVAWQGLEEMTEAWAADGDAPAARQAGAAATRLHTALLRALRASERRLPDGALFVPAKLLGGEQPYSAVTASRVGSYWNLVAPYALASRLLSPGGAEARGAIAYLLNHGSRLLGLVRAGAYSLYGRVAGSGTDDVYELHTVRFLADNERWDQIVLSLYGQLAAGMTPGTFVSGEAASVAPQPGLPYRSMYLPPNSVANAAFLETLRLTLIHELPHGLELAFGTPRAWLRPGQQIVVTNAPTSFGPISYTLDAEQDGVHVTVDVPSSGALRTVKLRLRFANNRSKTFDLSGRRGEVSFVAGYA
jgi:hypothetical protein